LYRWRQQLAASRQVASFIPVTIVPAAPAPVLESAPPSAITIEFSGRVRLKVEGAPDAGTLASVIDALWHVERLR
jgi:hypothetical protein